MKHIIKKLVLFIAIGVIFTACDDRELETLDANANSTLSLSESSLVLSQFDDGQDVLTASWTEPNFGFDAALNYKILIDIAGGDFSNPKTIAVGSSLTKIFLKEDLNSKLNSLDVTPNVATNFDFKILTTLSDYSSVLSDAKTISITTYPAILDLSTTWGVAGSATPGSWDGPDLPFFQTGVNNVYVAYVNLADGEIKFRENNDWANNYGDDGNDLSLEAGGENIPVTAGSYKIVLDLNNLSYTISTFSWGIVGDATPNGWDGPDVILKYDEYSDTFRAVVILTTGNIKFRQNNTWDVNYGGTGTDGALESGGGDISVNAGSYLVTLNLTDPDAPFYTLETMDIWGIAGDATPNGWDGPDAKFTPDFAGNDGLYYLNDITLTSGSIKFRTNDSWDVNYGDTDADGVLEVGGGNITVSAGTYNITLDLSDSDNPTYIIN